MLGLVPPSLYSHFTFKPQGGRLTGITTSEQIKLFLKTTHCRETEFV